MGQVVSFNLDNMTAVAALAMGRSIKDELATTVTRVAGVVAAAIGCTMALVWMPRRSDRHSIIADNLTHSPKGSLSTEELTAYLVLGMVASPTPTLKWMENSVEDPFLGRKCELSLNEKFMDLPHLLPV